MKTAEPDGLEHVLRELTRQLRDAQLDSTYRWTSARCAAMSLALAVRLRLDGQPATTVAYNYAHGSAAETPLGHVAVRVGDWLADPSREQFYSTSPTSSASEPLAPLVEPAAEVEGRLYLVSDDLDLGPPSITGLVHLIATELAVPVDNPESSGADANIALAWGTILAPLRLTHLWVHGLCLMAGLEPSRCCCCERRATCRLSDPLQTPFCEAHRADWSGGRIAAASFVALRCLECDATVWDYGHDPDRNIAVFCANDHATPLEDAVVRIASPARNDPCPCGSGRKAKRCCFA